MTAACIPCIPLQAVLLEVAAKGEAYWPTALFLVGSAAAKDAKDQKVCPTSVC